MSTEIIEIVKSNPYFEILENGKIRCKLTNHEMNPDVSKYNEYIKSKGYQKAIEKDFDFDQYKPHIVPFKGAEEHFLWCHLTQTKVPRMKNVILRHVEGKKYQRLLSLFNQKKQEREQKKKITLLKSKKLTKEEEEDKFDENFIDRMIFEFEEDERLNDKDLDGDESYSNDLYQKVHANSIHEQDDKPSKKSKLNKRQNGNKANEDDDIEGEDDEEEDMDDEHDNEEDLEDEEDYDSENEEMEEEDSEENENQGDEEEVDNKLNEEEEIPDSKQAQKENSQKNANKFKKNFKKFNGNNKQHNNQNNNQGVNKFIKKNKQNHFNKFKQNNNNKKKFQKN
ncbi:surfeit locus protein (macronuclear) [Tetrahymena thermophila SB210]|uniref:Surfeit locus protein n=1 Tax=Tetrahymena thermophila (strain SB210) TaxID=312017 RepID=Q22TK7_TETTS|nr:surfeit locus protein [Tetrahymena thermophila SB210]EAR88431.1 surfeit locus protein [Tetrahymena thermophila SB210]|eukprot:XP_001008676.1 surfeit locus protein [Tetrahymena thermophila SB210]